MTPKNLIKKFSLARVEITVTESVFIARAFPDNFHPIVRKRRDEAYAALDKGDGVALSAISKANEDSMREIARESGNSIEDVMERLERALKQL
jgi:hypothetical protein